MPRARDRCATLQRNLGPLSLKANRKHTRRVNEAFAAYLCLKGRFGIRGERNKFLGTGEPGYHLLRKMKTVASGLRFAVRYDFSVAYELVLSTILLAVALLFQDWVHLDMILLATGHVVMAELLNSAVEAVCDFMETRQNEKVRAIKDIAAAAVGISIAIWLAVVVSDVVRVVRLIWPSNPWPGLPARGQTRPVC